MGIQGILRHRNDYGGVARPMDQVYREMAGFFERQ